ncbi:ABC transporter permease [Nitriliruptor alkaliphilus]|uniref:ABC transporter permease n=1 Tax=Nitriliruptor alkaliphilus TaxID=427918 RepID=UPI0006982AE2|nr:ABC transporter permease [Nitriliruptor alkaliphilus]
MAAGEATPTRLSPGTRAMRTVSRPLRPFEELSDQMKFWGEAIGAMPYSLKWWRSVILPQISDVVVGAGSLIVGGGMLFVIAALAFFTGTQVGLQGVAALDQIGAQAYVGLISSFANVREITPLIAGIALAAKIGAGYTAELGAMRISEEIDAAEVIGIRPIPYLVSTRLWAALIPTIPLYLLALFSAFFATRLIVTGFYTVSPGAYDTRLDLFLPPIDILYSVIKAVIFVIVVVLIHTYYGFYAKGGPAGVGVAVGRAIRASITAVVILNMVLSLAFWAAGGETIKIAG